MGSYKSYGGSFSGGTTTLPILAPNGSAAAPSYSFSSRTGDGMYDTGAGVGLAVGGLNVATFLAATTTLAQPLQLPAGTAANPSWAVGGEQTGAYLVGAGVLGFAVAGAAAYSAAVLGNNVQLMNRVTNNTNAGFLFYTGSGALAGSIDASSGLVVRSGGVAASPAGNNGSSGTIRWDGVASSNGAVGRIEATTQVTGSMSGASVTLTNAIPAGAVVLGVCARVNTAITGAGGATSFQIGDGTDVDRFGTGIAFAQGTQTTNASWTIANPPMYPAATNIVLTPNAGTFSTGVVRVLVYYTLCGAPTS